jgi:hypothetical protein
MYNVADFDVRHTSSTVEIASWHSVYKTRTQTPQFRLLLFYRMTNRIIALLPNAWLFCYVNGALCSQKNVTYQL